MDNISKSYISELKKTLDLLDLNRISKIVQILEQLKKNRRTLYIIGNGGSAACASHLAADLHNSINIKAICLSDNTSLITALANDLKYDDIFSEQIKRFGGIDDVLIAISASGNSRNIIKAIKLAKSLGIKTVGLLGFNNGGKAAKLVDYPIIIKSKFYGPVEDVHLIINHIITSSLNKNLK